jgi:phage gpG-like protein
LRDTGILANSISYNVLRKGVEIGTKVRYAGTHQFGARQGQYGRTKRGGPIPWGNIPARPFLPTDGLPPEWRSEVLSILSRHLDNQ